MADQSLMEMITAFLTHLSDERQLSQHTVDAYRRDLTSLAQFLEAKEIIDWSDVASHHLQAFITEGHRQGRSGRTLKRRLSACRTFFNYLAKEAITTTNPAMEF